MQAKRPSHNTHLPKHQEHALFELLITTNKFQVTTCGYQQVHQSSQLQEKMDSKVGFFFQALDCIELHCGPHEGFKLLSFGLPATSFCIHLSTSN